MSWKELLAVLTLVGGLTGSVLQAQEPAGPVVKSADSPNPGVVRLSMAETLRRVEEANLNVLLSKEAVLQAIEAANRERSSILPRVDIDVQQTRSKFLFNQVTGTQSDSSTVDRFSARLVGNFTIIDPTARAIYEAARRGITVAEYEYELALQEALSASIRTFYTHERNLAGMTLVESNIERAQVLLDLATDQVNAGVATQIDLTRARAQLAGEEQARLQQQTVVVESGLQLKQILNVDPRAELELAPFRMNEVESGIPPVGDPLVAMENRREYQQAQEQLEQNKLEQRASRWQRFPSVDLFGEYGYGSLEAFDFEGEDSWLVGVALSVPVFDGLQIESNKRLADSRIRAQELRIKDLENQIRSELEFAVQDARSRLAQISVAEENKNLADEELHLARIRFEQGVADNREVIDAQNAVAQANDNLIQAIYLYNISRLELARVRGEVRTILSER